MAKLENTTNLNGWFYLVYGYDANDERQNFVLFGNEEEAENFLAETLNYEGDVEEVYFSNGKRVIEK